MSTSVPDGAGGTYLAWSDFRDGLGDIYLLRVTNAGTVASGWPASGLPVCTAPSYQFDPSLVPDGANGVIVLWHDYRNAWGGGEIWAQRVSPAGATLWAANGVKIEAGFVQLGQIPGLAPDGTGGLLVAWSQGDPGDIYALRIDATGSVPSGWSATGNLVCADPGNQANPVIAAGGSGGAVVAWEDQRAGNAIFAQKLDASGVAQWTPDGIPLESATFANQPAMLPDGSGGAYVCWLEVNTTALMRAQHVSGGGTMLWAGTDMSGPISFANNVGVAEDGLGGLIATWNNYLAGGHQIVAQRVDDAGTVQWGGTGAVLASFPPTQFASGLVVAPDPSGAAYFSWVQSGADITQSDLRVQRVSSSGAVSWITGGQVVFTNPFSYAPYTPSAAPDGSGGLLIAWPIEDRAGIQTIYAQRYDAGGSALLGSGVKAFDDPGLQPYALTVSDDSGGAWIVFGQRSDGQEAIRARHVDSAGAPAGPTIDVASAAEEQSVVGAIPDGQGGVIIAWTNVGAAGFDLHAQRLNASGTPQWGAGGTLIGSDVFIETTSMISDQSNGAIFAWDRFKNGGAIDDIYAQRVNGAGVAQWGADGFGVCTDPAYQHHPFAVPDGAGGAIIVWEDRRAATQIYGQHMSADGTPQWAANGLSLVPLIGSSYVEGAASDGGSGAIVLSSTYGGEYSAAPDTTAFYLQKIDNSGAPQWGGGVTAYYKTTDAAYPRIVADGTGGAILCWADGRNGPFDVYMQRVGNDGTLAHGIEGLAVCTSTGWQLPSGMFASAGAVTIAWSDERAGRSDAYAQRVNADGSLAWTPSTGVPLCTAARGQYGVSAAPDNGNGALFSWVDYRSGTERLIYSQHLDSGGAPTWIGDGVVPVTVSLASISAKPGGVALKWLIVGPLDATVERTEDGASWTRLATVAADGLGYIAYEDRAVTPGARYGYRLALATGGTTSHGGEVWVEVPAPAFRLVGAKPNPARGSAWSVSFALASREPARLEVLDLAGRTVAARELSGLEPGNHEMHFDRPPTTPGVYFLRLTQGGRSLTARAVVLRE